MIAQVCISTQERGNEKRFLEVLQTMVEQVCVPRRVGTRKTAINRRYVRKSLTNAPTRPHLKSGFIQRNHVTYEITTIMNNSNQIVMAKPLIWGAIMNNSYFFRQPNHRCVSVCVASDNCGLSALADDEPSSDDKLEVIMVSAQKRCKTLKKCQCLSAPLPRKTLENNISDAEELSVYIANLTSAKPLGL